MLAILWLIVWATVAEAFYDDYSWYTSDDGVSNARAFDSQRLVRENFTNILRSFAESYVPSREGDEELTMAKAKSRLRSLKVFKHTGKSGDFESALPNFPESTENIKEDEIMGTSHTDTEYVPKFKMPRRFRYPPAQCLIQQEKYKIDWCNLCYCNDFHQRVCTDWTCKNTGPPPRERRRCFEGARYQRGKCKYCYCNVGGVMICNTRNNCNEPWWYLVHGLTKFEPQTPYEPTSPTPKTTTTKKTIATTSIKPNITRTTPVNSNTTKRAKRSKYRAKVSYRKTLECIEGSYYKIDSCNYCSCSNGNKLCTNIPCPVNNLGMVNAAKSSVEHIESEENMEPSDIDSHSQVKSGHKGGLRFLRQAPAKCLIRHEKYRIDWCNWCYCNDYYQRVCTDWKCPDHGGKPPPRERKKCIVGARYQRGKCKYCYCNVGSVMICNTRRNCTEPWWYLVKGHTKYEPQTSYVPPLPTTMPVTTKKANSTKHTNVTKHTNLTKHSKHAKHTNATKNTKFTKKSHATTKYKYTIKPITYMYLRNGERECIEGSKYKKDSCNFCSCINGKEMCTSKSCVDIDFDPGPNKVQIPEDMVNAAELSLGPMISGPSDIDTEIISDKKYGQQFRLAPSKCLPDHELYRIDWCNWCYCNDYYQRVCTDFPCDDHGGRPYPSERKKCMPGARYERGKCKYCYCNVRNKMICKTIKDCDEPWWYLEYGTTKWRPQTLPPNNEQKATNWHLSLPGTTIPSRKLTTERPSTTLRPNTTENSRFHHTPCRDDDLVPDNNMIKLAGQMVNAAKPSFENIDNNEDIEPNQISTELSYGQKKGLRIKLPPATCIKHHEKYRIDWCNWCYCNEFYQRVCTDWGCPDHGGEPFPAERKKCLVGAKYERGKCKYCYCKLSRVLTCKKRTDCNEPWWFLVHNSTTKFRPQTPYRPTLKLPTVKTTKRDVMKLSNTRANTTTTPTTTTKPTSTTSPSDTIKRGSFILPNSDTYPYNNMVRLPDDMGNTGKSSFENIESNEIMGPSNSATQFKPDEKGALRFRLPPEKCLQEHERYRIDRCNWCYCDEYFRRICTDWKCPDHGDKPHQPEQKKCLSGARYTRGRCKFCYCNKNRTIICSTKKNCTETWWYVVHGADNKDPDLPPTTRIPSSKTQTKLFYYRVLLNAKIKDKRKHKETKEHKNNKGKGELREGKEQKEMIKKKERKKRKEQKKKKKTEKRKEKKKKREERKKRREMLKQIKARLDSQSETNPDSNYDKGQCVEGSYYKVDSCNYCICFNRNYMCTSNRCPANELDILNDPESSFPTISKDPENDKIMDLSYVQTQVIPDEKDERRRFQPAPKKCNTKLEKYRIDWCNWCYCNAQYQRVCTDWNCNHQGGDRPPRETKKCIVGARYERGKCKYCYCGVGYSLICQTRDSCSLNRRRRSSNSLRTTLNYKCDAGIIQQIDDCNYCLCTRGRKWKCTQIDCPSNYAHNQGALRMTYHHNSDGSTKTCNIGEKLRLDACNYCYCNENRVKICTQNKCKQQEEIISRFPLDSTEENDCKLGTRFRQGECNYCYCNINHKLVCSVNQCLRRSINSGLPHNKITIINL